MEAALPNQSPPLIDTASWIPYWDGEDISLGGLNIEATTELNNLVEDKEIAAKAVAFVVNSTRKGIVPLCADVANLMRARCSLERKLTRLRSENTVFRSTFSESLRTSTSTSPMPASLSSYSDNKHHLHYKQEACSPICSRCSSQCSSLTSNSPKFEKHFTQRSPRLHRTSAFSIPDSYSQHHDYTNNHVTIATVHGLSSSDKRRQKKKLQRKKSLPEIISEPHENVPKISPRSSKVSKEVQCEIITEASSSECREKQFRETLEVNARLAEDLGAAKKEIEVLKEKLQELEMRNFAIKHVKSEQFYIENEYCGPGVCPQSVSRQDGSVTNVNHSVSHQRCVSQPPTCVTMTTKLKAPICMEPPLDGCKCVACDSSKLQCPKRNVMIAMETTGIAIGDHVVLVGQKTGCVMYIGHIEGAQDTYSLFLGLQVDAPVGCHDGVLEGRRYFTCEKNCGMFVPVQDVVHVIQKDKNISRCSTMHQSGVDPEEPSYYGKQSADHPYDNIHINQSQSKHGKAPEKSKISFSKAPALSAGHNL